MLAADVGSNKGNLDLPTTPTGSLHAPRAHTHPPHINHSPSLCAGVFVCLLVCVKFLMCACYLEL